MEMFESIKNVAFFSLDPIRIYHVVGVFCLIVVLFKITKLTIIRNKFIRGLRYFPGPPPHWLFGNVHELHQDGTDLDKFVKWGEKYPLGFPLWFGPFVAFVNVHHPDYVKTVVTSTEPKDDMAYRFIVPWIGEGLLVLAGQKWYRHRRLITPGFHFDVLKDYVKLMGDSAKIMLDKWNTHANQGDALELFKPVSLMTLDTIMKCAFSCQSNCQTESGTNSYIQAVYELSTMINIRFRFFPYHHDLIYYLSPHGYKFRKAYRIAHHHTENVIQQRKEALKNEEELGISQKKRNLDFLDILLCARDEDQQGLSDEDIRAEVDTFMFEGHDTTASGISWILYGLACHPEHQQKCRQEVLELLQERDIIEWEDLNKLPYTTMCMKECLRMYPPVPWIARKLSKPMTFFDGRTLPEGFLIGISIYALHMNATVWEHPEEFDPLRFLPENCSKRSPHAFLPFSAGPRNCIGQNFAMNEMKVAVALTLKRYKLERDPDHVPKMIPRMVLRSLNGIYLKIRHVEPDH